MNNRHIEYDYIPAFDTIYNDDKPYYFLWGGRGGGKSYFIGDYLLDRSYMETGVYLITREKQNTIADSNYALLKGRIEQRDLPAFHVTNNNVLNTKTGSNFIFHGLSNITKENVKSTFNVKRAWCEESQTLSKESIEILYPTVRDNDSHLYFTFNRIYDNDPVYEFFKTFNCKGERLKTKVDGKYYYWYLHRSADAIGININWDGNPYFTEKLNKDRLRDKDNLPDYDYEHIWNGKPRNITDATILRNIYIHDFDIDVSRQPHFGIDFGFVDPNAITQSYIYDNELYICREYYSNNLDPEQLKQELLKIEWIRGQHLVADSSQPAMIKMLNSTGYIQVSPARKNIGQQQKEGAYKFTMAMYLKQFRKIHIHETNCPNAAREFPRWSFEVDKNEKIYDKVQDGSDHTIDCTIYALEREASNWFRENHKR